MFINRYLLNFAEGSGLKIVKACLLQLLLALLATGASLCSAIIIRMLQGEESVLFFCSLWQVFRSLSLADRGAVYPVEAKNDRC